MKNAKKSVVKPPCLRAPHKFHYHPRRWFEASWLAFKVANVVHPGVLGQLNDASNVSEYINSWIWFDSYVPYFFCYLSINLMWFGCSFKKLMDHCYLDHASKTVSEPWRQSSATVCLSKTKLLTKILRSLYLSLAKHLIFKKSGGPIKSYLKVQCLHILRKKEGGQSQIESCSVDFVFSSPSQLSLLRFPHSSAKCSSTWVVANHHSFFQRMCSKLKA